MYILTSMENNEAVNDETLNTSTVDTPETKVSEDPRA
jgi:hypothetical protein